MSATEIILNDDRAAKIIGTTTARIRRWVRQGILPGRKLPDGSVIISTNDLAKWIESTGAKAVACG